MINHARTLLVNVDGTDNQVFRTGDEIIPAAYKAKINLPSYIRTMRRIIFGDQPDSMMLNYRARQLMAMLHSSELEQFVTALDPRITYDFSNTDLLDDTLYGLTTTQFGSTLGEIDIYGTAPSADRSGKLSYEWYVSFNHSTPIVTATIYNPYDTTSATPTFTDSLSQGIALPNSKLYVRVKDSGASSNWIINYNVRPTRDLGEILADIDTIGEPAIVALFARDKAKGRQEPFKTFYNLWRHHYALPYRLGGAVMAMLYQMNELT